jgi:diadenosine tetraphosphate (Ap4A) HIT family hydrolase
MDDFEEICAFCAEATREPEFNAFQSLNITAAGDYSYILDENKTFVVIPCIGALTSEYVLLVPKRHVLSVGWLNDDEILDMFALLETWLDRISRNAGGVLLLEHGSLSFRNKGGSCYDHAHLHLVGTPSAPETILEPLQKHVDMKKTSNWTSAAKDAILREHRSYVVVSDGSDAWIGDAASAPSQFFRKALVDALNLEDGSWDWLMYPNRKTVQSMIDRYGTQP